MRPDPTTDEGKEEIRKILEKRKLEAEKARKRSEENIEEETTGKLTNPSEIDVHKDRRVDNEQ